MTIFIYKGLSKNQEIRNTRLSFAHWGKLGIPNLAQMSQMKSYWMLQIIRITAFIISELSERKPGGG